MEPKKLVISTEILKDLVSKAVKGCSMVEAIPLTCYMELLVTQENDKKMLKITTTDFVNYLTMSAELTEAEELHAVVDAKLFASLVSKLTTATTAISVQDGKVVVTANGTYNFPIKTDNDGSWIRFPEQKAESLIEQSRLSNLQIKSILTLSKSCKADMKEVPTLYNYYMDNERVLTTDFYKVCSNPVKVFNDATCLAPEFVELLPVVADDNGVTIQCNDTEVVVYSLKGKLHGKKCLPEEVTAYPVNDLVQTIQEKLNYACKINRTLLINALDRICLFTGAFQSNQVTVTFTKSNVAIKSGANEGQEVIHYLAPIDTQEEINFSCDIDGSFFKNQLASCTREDLTLNFGSDSGIQIVCDNVVLILSTLGDEEDTFEQSESEA